MKRNKIIGIVGLACYALFLLVSWIVDFGPGKEISRNFATFAIEMLKIIPCVFILIGLFQVWVRRETIERYFGEESGIRGYVWAVLLAGTTVGGLYIAFPVAYSLYTKGAKLSVIFTYIGASALCRIPMATFEASFLGVKFTLIRLIVSLPLVVVTSILLGNYLTRRSYKITELK
ncbi:permease [Chloroflexota bacterium]